LFLALPSPKLNIGDITGQNRTGLLQFRITQGLAPFSDSNDLDQIVRGYSRTRLASKNIIQPRERTTFIIQSIVVEQRIANAPAREAIHDEIQLILGWAFRRRAVPRQDAFIESIYFIEERQLHLQSRSSFRANSLTEPSNDGIFVLVNDKKHRAPFETSKNKEHPEHSHSSGLQKPNERGRSHRICWLLHLTTCWRRFW